MTDLDKLIAAVEAGGELLLGDFFVLDRLAGTLDECGCSAAGAFNGSLDAAKALHDALLPGWIARPQIGGKAAGVEFWHCVVEDWETGAEVAANNMPDPARAWLLAVLKAYRAQDGKGGGE